MVEAAGPASPTEHASPPTESTGKHHRIEIIHESLLSQWPRLLRWRSQDTEGAQLRDELRQAAQVWEQHDHAEDYLWTGAAYLDYLAWRERYPGGLTAQEEAFSRAMTAKAGRRRRRLRLAVSVVILFLAAVAGAIGGLWRRSEAARRQAADEARRAEASKLLALGQLEVDRDHTAALAYALASLELADRPEARRFVVEALWRRPPYFAIPPTSAPPEWVKFSPDERWLGVGYRSSGELDIWPRGGGDPIAFRDAISNSGAPGFGAGSDVFVDGHLRIWSLPDATLLHTIRGADEPGWFGNGMLFPLYLSPDMRRLVTYQASSDMTRMRLHEWSIDDGDARELGGLEGITYPWGADPSGKTIWYAIDPPKEVFVLPLDGIGTVAPRRIGPHEREIWKCAFDPRAERLACGDVGGEIRIWSLTPGVDDPLRVLRSPSGIYPAVQFDGGGSLLASSHEDGSVRLWDLAGPPAADPLTVGFDSKSDVKAMSLTPSARWVAAANNAGGARIWPLGQPYARIFRGHEELVSSIAFDPQGEWIASSGYDGIRKWSLTYREGEAAWRLLFPIWSTIAPLATDRQVFFTPHYLFETDRSIGVGLLPVAGDPVERAPGPPIRGGPVAASPDGRFAAWGEYRGTAIRIWDTKLDRVETLDLGREERVVDLGLMPDGDVVAAYCPAGGETRARCVTRLWDLEKGTHEILAEGIEQFDLSRDGRRLLGLRDAKVVLIDLEQDRTTRLPSLDPAGATKVVALDPSGTLAVTGGEDGVIRVGPVSGGEPHLLLGHEGGILSLVVSPDGRWLASGGEDATLRLWPIPEGQPLHTLPHDELLAKLRSLTNLRVVEDPDSSTGWKLEVGPFPGWAEVPQW